MTMIKGAVFFDYDGTLVDEREELYVATQATKHAIRDLQANNYLCLLATGRALSYVPQGAKELGLDGFICSNGAFAAVNGQIIHREVFPVQEVHMLIEQMNQENVNYILESNNYCYVKNFHDSKFLKFMDAFHIAMDNFISMPDITEIEHEVEKITLIPKNVEQLHVWIKKLEDRYDCCCHRHVATFDITPLHLNKGVGVQHVIDHFAIPHDQTYAFGDGTNDVELLKRVNYGIAMHTHASELDEYAYMITKSVKDEGIYHALKKLEVIA